MKYFLFGKGNVAYGHYYFQDAQVMLSTSINFIIRLIPTGEPTAPFSPGGPKSPTAP